MNERIKVESNRQVSHYKTKHSEYKTKLRQANQNIQTLLIRLAKFDIQMAADDKPQSQYYGSPHTKSNISHDNPASFNLNELIVNDGLNEEIKKLLNENNLN